MTKANTNNMQSKASRLDSSHREIIIDPRSKMVGWTESADNYALLEESLSNEYFHAGIGNAFIFAKVMTTNPELLLELLQYSLPELHIRSIQSMTGEATIKFSIDAHGVQLDILTRDDQDRVIDIEMQVRDEKNIAKRTRYYQRSMDQTLLQAGQDYKDLNDSVILFITRFDPFERKRYRYTFRNICLEDKGLELGDGATKVILNAAGKDNENPDDAISSELKGFLELVLGNENCLEDSYAGRVQKQVVLARKNSRWRREYMDWKRTLIHERNLGEEQGVLNERISTVIKKVKKDMPLETIAKEMEYDVEIIQPIWKAVVACAPEYDIQTIKEKLNQ